MDMMDEELGRSDHKSDPPEKNKKRRDEVFTQKVYAGKRTYFFDVKSTRRNEYYLTITESKKRINREGRLVFEKHKLFLYKEDFQKFEKGLKEVINFVLEHEDEEVREDIYEENKPKETTENEVPAEEFTNVEFDDLGKK